MASADTLKLYQETGAEVERLMCEFLLQFVPAHELTVSNVLQIAGAARRISFGQFYAAQESAA